MLGVVYDGALSTDLLPLTVKLRWMGKVMQGYEQRYVLYRKAVTDLGAWYHAHGYRMMLLKGLACGVDWPRPEHRPYGDIDIWLFGRQQSADNEMFEEFKKFEGFKIDNSHHHHTVFPWQGFTVENHYDFVNVVAHRSSKELEKIFKELAFQDTSDILPLTSDIVLPSANMHALFLIRHMVSHFAAVGISLRQVLDWAFFVEKQGKEVDWEWLEKVLKEYHMFDFYCCINAICVEDLGFANTDFTNNTNGVLHSKSLEKLKDRILNDTLSPEFDEVQPKGLIRRVPFKYRRWKANTWKRELCYAESEKSSFWGGVWNYLLKPASI